MRALLDVLLIALQFYIWIVIIAVLLNWLIAFDVVNRRNALVLTIENITSRLTEPALEPIRKLVPSIRGIDISPIILIFLIILIQRIILHYVYPNVF